MTAPTLTGLTAPTFLENVVNASPQVIDSDVTLTDPDNDYNGGTLVVSGLLAEDAVAIKTGLVVYSAAGTVYYDARPSRSPSTPLRRRRWLSRSSKA